MTTKGPGEDNNYNKTTTSFLINTSTTMTTFSLYEIAIICVVVPVFVIVCLIAALVCYKRTICCRNSGNPHRQLNRSEGRDFYGNSTIIRGRRVGDSLETIVNRPLPHPPDHNRQSGGIPAIHEDDYLPPIQGDSFWLRRIEEIQQLPPAPPVFPGQLGRLLLDGEGAYAPVIPDDEAPLLSPGPMHEISHNQQSCEYNEEPGYEVPISPTWNSLQQNASVSSDTQNETERSDDTEGRIYRSECQLYLSPPTQHRRPPVPTRRPTVVVCIHTEL